MSGIEPGFIFIDCAVVGAEREPPASFHLGECIAAIRRARECARKALGAGAEHHFGSALDSAESAATFLREREKAKEATP